MTQQASRSNNTVVLLGASKVDKWSRVWEMKKEQVAEDMDRFVYL